MKNLTSEQVEIIKDQIVESVSYGSMYPNVARTLVEILEAAINYTHSCTELKDKETISFRDWVNQNKYTRFGNGYQRNEIVFSKEEMWQRFESRN